MRTERAPADDLGRARRVHDDVERKRKRAELRRLAADDGYRSIGKWIKHGRRPRAHPLGMAPVTAAELAAATRQGLRVPRRRTNPMVALLTGGRYRLSAKGKLVYTPPNHLPARVRR
jgi:hypothetical protein